MRAPWVALLLLPAVAACADSESAALPQGAESAELDPADFTPGSDHQYFPLTPGTQWRFRETDVEGSVQEVVVTVTSETRTLANGVEARVVRDTVSEGGSLVEDTFDWYAQDTDGNVWYLGEETAEFEDGRLASREGSFEAGVDGALPGVVMPAEPTAGQEYRQEYYAGQAEDNGAVIATGQQAEVPKGHFEDAVLSPPTPTPSSRRSSSTSCTHRTSGWCSPSTSPAGRLEKSCSPPRRSTRRSPGPPVKPRSGRPTSSRGSLD